MPFGLEAPRISAAAAYGKQMPERL